MCLAFAWAEKLHDALRGKDGTRPIIWLAGDSSLDNKHWLLDVPRVPAVGGLEDVIDPPLCTPDIAHQLSTECLRRGLPYAVINTAVEESTLGQRSCGLNLLPQVGIALRYLWFVHGMDFTSTP